MSHKRNEALRHVQHSMHHVIAAGEGSDRAPDSCKLCPYYRPDFKFRTCLYAHCPYKKQVNVFRSTPEKWDILYLHWGNENATDEEIEEACRLACADEFIQSFPDKYDTYIEQGGTNVSGGQKQRLCIARALLKKPKVLILDDSTSAVDTKTDASIQRSFAEFIPDTTKIIIAQRVSSVQHADRIVVMDDGKIAACGKHDELLKTCDIYREVYESQKKGDSDHE